MYLIAALSDDRNSAIGPWFHPRTYQEHGDADEALTRINQRRKNHGMSPAAIYTIEPVEVTLL